MRYKGEAYPEGLKATGVPVEATRNVGIDPLILIDATGC